jgi:hypothetical protein
VPDSAVLKTHRMFRGLRMIKGLKNTSYKRLKEQGYNVLKKEEEKEEEENLAVLFRFNSSNLVETQGIC